MKPDETSGLSKVDFVPCNYFVKCVLRVLSAIFVSNVCVSDAVIDYLECMLDYFCKNNSHLQRETERSADDRLDCV